MVKLIKDKIHKNTLVLGGCQIREMLHENNAVEIIFFGNSSHYHTSFRVYTTYDELLDFLVNDEKVLEVSFSKIR